MTDDQKWPVDKFFDWLLAPLVGAVFLITNVKKLGDWKVSLLVAGIYAATTLIAWTTKKTVHTGDEIRKDWRYPRLRFIAPVFMVCAGAWTYVLWFGFVSINKPVNLVGATLLYKQSFAVDPKFKRRLIWSEESDLPTYSSEVFQPGDSFKFEFQLDTAANWRMLRFSPKGEMTEWVKEDHQNEVLDLVRLPEDIGIRKNAAEFEDSDVGVLAYVFLADSKLGDLSGLEQSIERANVMPTQLDSGLAAFRLREVFTGSADETSELEHLRELRKLLPDSIDVVHVTYLQVALPDGGK